MPASANDGPVPDRIVASILTSLSDLLTFGRDTDALALLQSTAGDFAPDMARIFPGDWAWAAVAAPRATRHIWFGVLSGFDTLPKDCAQLRANLLTLNHGLMLRLRFGDVGAAMGRIVIRIERYPLPRNQYDRLARILLLDPGVIAALDKRPGVLETADFVETFPLPLQDDPQP